MLIQRLTAIGSSTGVLALGSGPKPVAGGVNSIPKGRVCQKKRTTNRAPRQPDLMSGGLIVAFG
jgi:hypothetical protein